MEKNKVILIYKSIYDEIGSFTASSSELLILTNDKCVIYKSGSGYEGDDDHIASRLIDLSNHSKFIDDCYSHILFSFENKENVVDCDHFGGTNKELCHIKIVNKDEIDARLVNGELYFEREYELINSLKFNEYYSLKPFIYSLAGIIPSSMWPNFIKAYIAPIDELAKKTWKEENDKLQSDKPFNGVYFGSYSQSQLLDEDIIKKLNEKFGVPETNNMWMDYGYRAKDYQGGYMFYIDVELDNNKYRGVYIKEFRPNTSRENIARNFDSTQSMNGFKKDMVYWFKYEPIVWVKCSTSSKQQYLSLHVLDAEPMCEDVSCSNDVSASSLYNVSSSLRKWLKDTFVVSAIKEDNRPYIDVDLLTKKEYLEYFPLKKQRKPRPTDYALIKGYLPDLRSRGNDCPFVWTATYIEGYNRMVSISKDGSIIDFYSENHGYIDFVYGGVQPSFTLDFRKKIPPENRLEIDFNNIEDRDFGTKPIKEEERTDFFTTIDDDMPF